MRAMTLANRVRLAGAGDAEQRLVRQPVEDALGELVDRLGLVARGGERLVQPEGAIREGDDVQGAALLFRGGTIILSIPRV